MDNKEPETTVHATKEIEELVAEGKIGLINCDTINPVFHRYFPLKYLEQMLNEKKLAFVYPKLWNDPYETLYLTMPCRPEHLRHNFLHQHFFF